MFEHIKPLQKLGRVNGDELGPVDLVTGADRQRPKSQMGDSGSAGFLGVIDKMALGKQLRALTQDLDAGLVAADSAIGTETEEQRPAGFRGFNIQFAIHLQRKVADIVPHADGEAGFRRCRFKFVENGADHGRRKLTGRQPISAANHPGQYLPIPPAVGLHQGTADFQQQGLTLGSRFLGAIQHREMFDGIGQSVQKTRRGKGPEQADLENPDLLTLRQQPLHRFMGAFGPGTHQDDHSVGLRVPNIIKQTVLPTGDTGETVHHGFKLPRECLIEGIDGLPGLEEGVRVLGGAANHWPVRCHPAAAMCFNSVVRYQRLQILVTERRNLGDFMGGAKAVEEMHHRHPAFQGDGVADGRKVLGLLYRPRSQQGKAGTAGTHYIGMVAEDRQGMGGNAARSNMHAEGRQLTGNLVQIGQHQQQPLGRSKGGHQ